MFCLGWRDIVEVPDDWKVKENSDFSQEKN